MMNKEDILKIVRHIKKRGRGIPDRKLVHPARDWLIGLLTASVLFLVGSLYSGYAFMERTKSVGEEVQLESSVVRYDQDRTHEVLESYRERAARFEALRNDRSRVYVPPPPVTENEEPESPVSEEVADENSEG